MSETLTKSEITNECICCDENGEPTPYDCYGCWDDEVEIFGENVSHLLERSDCGWWKIDGLPLWDRTESGTFHATTAEELLRAITVDSSWILRYRVMKTQLVGVLSHHDAPMGGTITVRPIRGELFTEWS